MTLYEDVCTAGPGFAPATTLRDVPFRERLRRWTAGPGQEEGVGDEVASLCLRSVCTETFLAMTHSGSIPKSATFGPYLLQTVRDAHWVFLCEASPDAGSSLPITISEADSAAFTLHPKVQPGSLRELLTTDPLSILPTPHAGAELDSLLRFLRENQPDLYEELLQTAVTGREKEVAETLEFLGAVSFPEGMTHEDIAESDWEAADLQDSPMSEGTS